MRVDSSLERFSFRHMKSVAVSPQPSNIATHQEVDMKTDKQRFIMDLERLNHFNSEGCPACGHKFSLGDPVVVACGAWEGGPRIVHENEAVFDSASGQYVERRCWAARGGAV
jgi:hypothetical protein